VGAVSVSHFVMLYGWFTLAALLMFLLLIARFYQRFSGESTYFQWFLMPILLFGAATVRYTSIDQIAGDGLGDILLVVGGAALGFLCVRLYTAMTRNR
jgi:membrane-associated phospholipid phosphatase